MIIAAVNSVTAVGFTAEATAAAVRAGISRLQLSEHLTDSQGRPITVAEIPDIDGISDDLDPELRLRSIARFSLAQILAKLGPDRASHCHLLLGTAPHQRPGPRYVDGQGTPFTQALVELLLQHYPRATVHTMPQGNAAAMYGLERASRILQEDRTALCIIGALDSLLDDDTLEWLEEGERVKSETFGRNQALPPAEAVGFFAVESQESAKQRGHEALARIVGVGVAEEPNPIISDRPCRAAGLTTASRIALAGVNSESIDTILGDLNGEFFRAREWAYADIRCFGSVTNPRQLWHPADCLGDVGAASGAILINLGVMLLAKGLGVHRLFSFCSDDHGGRGAVVLGPV